MCEELDWKTLYPTAQRIFNIWSHGKDLEWAEHTWHLLSKAGLTQYNFPLELCQVSLKFLALASIYIDYCYIAAQEYIEPEYRDWAEKLEIKDFYLGQLLSENSDFDYIDDYYELIGEVLNYLIDHYRELVWLDLYNEYGSIINIQKSLHWSSYTQYDDDGNELSLAEIDVDFNFDNLHVYTWIDGEVDSAITIFNNLGKHKKLDKIPIKKLVTNSKNSAGNNAETQLIQLQLFTTVIGS